MVALRHFPLKLGSISCKRVKLRYVVLISALAVLQQALRDTPAGFLDPALGGWWACLVGLVGDAGLYVRLRASLEKAERASRGKGLQEVPFAPPTTDNLAQTGRFNNGV